MIDFGNDCESALNVYNTVIVDEELSSNVTRNIELVNNEGTHSVKLYVNKSS